ncbi:MAG: C-terminal binding protein, partial [Alphaproteobacteria bacterium]
MTKFTILTPAAASFTTGGGGYEHELEALEGMGAEIVECAPSEDAFVAAAPSADAVYAKGMKFTARM